jgi:hypothetical protein
MKLIRYVFSCATAVALIAATVLPALEGSALAQRKTPTAKKAPAKAAPKAPPTVYDQGYLKGYDDGFAQGESDWKRKQPRDYRASQAYTERQSAYDPKHADDDEYTLGYDLGLELGYNDGYLGRAPNHSVPANGSVIATAAAIARAEKERKREARRDAREQAQQSRISAILNIPRGTELQIRLSSPISTKENKVGDRFTATVVSPQEYEGATVEGHIATLRKSGRVTGKTELGLAFDRIFASEDQSAPLEAELIRVIESEKVKKIDEEGRIETGSRSKDSTVRGGVGAAAGAVIGGIAGGGKGALLGAIIGGAAGVGTVAIEGSKDLVLETGTEMIIKTLKPGSR